MKKKSILLIFLCIGLIAGSLMIGTIRGGSFTGADDKIEGTIKDVNANYKPWFNHFWQPPSSEVESLLFASQAAIGAVFIGYYIGRKKNAKVNNGTVENQ